MAFGGIWEGMVQNDDRYEKKRSNNLAMLKSYTEMFPDSTPKDYMRMIEELGGTSRYLQGFLPSETAIKGMVDRRKQLLADEETKRQRDTVDFNVKLHNTFDDALTDAVGRSENPEQVMQHALAILPPDLHQQFKTNYSNVDLNSLVTEHMTKRATGLAETMDRLGIRDTSKAKSWMESMGITNKGLQDLALQGVAQAADKHYRENVNAFRLSISSLMPALSSTDPDIRNRAVEYVKTTATSFGLGAGDKNVQAILSASAFIGDVAATTAINNKVDDVFSGAEQDPARWTALIDSNTRERELAALDAQAQAQGNDINSPRYQQQRAALIARAEGAGVLKEIDDIEAFLEDAAKDETNKAGLASPDPAVVESTIQKILSDAEAEGLNPNHPRFARGLDGLRHGGLANYRSSRSTAIDQVVTDFMSNQSLMGLVMAENFDQLNAYLKTIIGDRYRGDPNFLKEVYARIAPMIGDMEKKKAFERYAAEVAAYKTTGIKAYEARAAQQEKGVQAVGATLAAKQGDKGIAEAISQGVSGYASLYDADPHFVETKINEKKDEFMQAAREGSATVMEWLKNNVGMNSRATAAAAAGEAFARDKTDPPISHQEQKVHYNEQMAKVQSLVTELNSTLDDLTPEAFTHRLGYLQKVIADFDEDIEKELFGLNHYGTGRDDEGFKNLRARLRETMASFRETSANFNSSWQRRQEEQRQAEVARREATKQLGNNTIVEKYVNDLVAPTTSSVGVSQAFPAANSAALERAIPDVATRQAFRLYTHLAKNGPPTLAEFLARLPNRISTKEGIALFRKVEEIYRKAGRHNPDIAR